MSSENHQNADLSTIAGYLKPLVADVGVVAIFGFCYVLYRYVAKIKERKGEEVKYVIMDKKEKSDKWTNAKTLTRINFLIQSNRDKNMDAFKILQIMNKNSLVPDIHTYNALIDMSYHLSHLTVARKLFEEIKDFTSPVQADIVTYNILLKGLVEEIKKCKEEGKESVGKLPEFVEEILKLTEEIRVKNMTQNLVTFNTLIDAYVELNKIEQAWNIFSTMCKSELPEHKPDVYTYSTLIKGLKNQANNDLCDENLLRALSLLEKIENGECGENVKADDILYNSVIDICIKYNRMNKAEEIFKQMKDKCIKPSIITYSIMIKGYGMVNKLQSAINLFQELKANEIRPNEILYGTLLNTASKCNRIDIMTEIYQTMIKDNIQPNHVIYSQMIKAHSKCKNYLKAFEIFDSVPEEIKNTSNIIMYNIILDTYADSEEYDKLFHLYEDMKVKCEKIDTFPRFNVITYSTVIKGLAKSKRLTEAKELYKYLKDNAYMLDEILFNTVCDAFAKAGEVDMALTVLQDMKVLNVKRDSVIYAIILKMYSNQLNEEKVIQVYDEMLKDGIKPNLVVYTTLMQMYIKKKKLLNACHVFADMKTAGVVPDTVTYNFIINGCTFNQKLEKAIEFLLEALRNKTRLSPETYKNVLEYLLNNKFMKVHDRVHFATEILKEMKNSNLKLNDDLNARVGKLIYHKSSTNVVNKENNNYINNNNKNYNSYKSFDRKFI